MKTIAVVLRFPTFSVEGSSIDTRTFKTATKDLSGKPFTVDPDISYVDLRDAIMNASRTRGLLIDDLHGKLFTTSSSSNSTVMSEVLGNFQIQTAFKNAKKDSGRVVIFSIGAQHTSNDGWDGEASFSQNSDGGLLHLRDPPLLVERVAPFTAARDWQSI